MAKQEVDSVRISSDTHMKILQDHMDAEFGTDRYKVIDVDLLKRKDLVEVYVELVGE